MNQKRLLSNVLCIICVVLILFTEPVTGQLGVTTCTFATQANCPNFLPNSYCDVVNGLCKCPTVAGYVNDGTGTACTYDCGALSAPINGGVSTADGTFMGDVATYSCNNGYKVVGSATRTCVQDIGWINTAPTCTEGVLGDDCSSNIFLCGNIAFGTCKDFSTCTCQVGYEDDGTGQNCKVVVDCGDVPTIDNGLIILQDQSNSTLGAAAIVNCDIGFQTAQTKILCLESGFWDNATCTIIDCGNVPIISRGTIILEDPDDSVYGSAANVSCDVGFNTTHSFIFCLDSGQWENASCAAIDCMDYQVSAGSSKYSSGTTFGSIVTITCDSGYNISTDANVTCQADGNWSDVVTCEPSDCGSPAPANGIYTGSTTFGATGTISCRSGYDLEGDAVVSCTADGWDGSANCTIKDCSDPTPENGIAEAPKGTTYGEIANVSCNEGFTLLGNTFITCLANGSWSDYPNCIILDCMDYQVFHGTVTYSSGTTFGSTVTITCDSGYNISSAANVTCQADGTWSDVITCDPIDCGSPAPANGIYTGSTTFGAAANISCRSGYVLNGEEVVTCTASGWNDYANCTIIDCGHPAPENGIAEAPKGTTYGEVANVSCNEGYTRTGNAFITCLATGFWSDYPNCSIVVCPQPPSSVDLNVQLMQYDDLTYGQVLTIVCRDGYKLNDSSEEIFVCDAFGKWNGSSSIPKCVEFGCTGSDCYNNGTCLGGDLVCTCANGYEGQQCEKALIGKSCSDINTDCKSHNSVCQNNVCQCKTKIYNAHTDTCDSMPLYNYGETVDTSLKEVDDACSEAIRYMPGIPVFDRPIKYTHLYVCTNGIVSFGKPYLNNIPSSNLLNRDDLALLAPFFADAKLSGSGRLYYRSLDIINNGSKLREEAKGVEEIIVRFGSISSFKTQFILFATWHRVLPVQKTFAANKTSSFQLVLATDGEDTFVLYIYQNGGMNWTNARLTSDVLVGYLIGKHTYAHVNSFRSSVLAMDKNVVTNGVIGLMVRRLTPAGLRLKSEAKECLRWYSNNAASTDSFRLAAKRLPECPCNLISLMFDSWFSFPTDKIAKDIYCTTAWPSRRTLPFGKTCCYNMTTRLWTDQIPYAGGLQHYHRFSDRKNHILNDIATKENCCVKSNLCNLYYELHPVGTCYPITWFQFGTFWGDPHFRTLDNFNFTFNGWGEYILLQLKTDLSDFELQARTERAEIGNDIRNFSDATVFSAFAVWENDNSLFHVELDGNKTGIILYGNGIDLTRQFSEASGVDTVILNSSASNNVTILKRNSTLRVHFTLTGVSLDVTVGVRMLTLNTKVPTVYNGTTSGLLGNFDGNPFNDFQFPNSTGIPSNISEAEIHRYGMTWEINPERSGFVYENLKTHASYQNNSHVPTFQFDSSSPDVQFCGGVQECIFDRAFAGIAVAADTLNTDMLAKVNKIENNKSNPKISGCPVMKVLDNVGYCNVTVSSADSYTLTLLADQNTVSYENTTSVVKVEVTHGNFDSLKDISLEVETVGNRKDLFKIHVLVCNCSGHGRCRDKPRFGSDVTATLLFSECECDSEFDDTNECVLNEDVCEHNCINTEGSFECICKEGYTKNPNENTRCRDVNECEELLHNCTQVCTNTHGEFLCSCFEGHSFNVTAWSCISNTTRDRCSEIGLNCSETSGCTVDGDNKPSCYCNSGYELYKNGTKCRDLDECKLNVCPQNCTNIHGSYECSCFAGFRIEGRTTCKECEVPYFGHNCESQCDCTGQGARLCHPVRGCVCNSGWQGVTCDDDIDECKLNPCSDVRKECINTLGSFLCQCRTGYEADENGNCTDIDECEVPTLNECDEAMQICSNTVSGYTCSCRNGYSMVNGSCKDIDECKTGSHECAQLCVNVPGQYNCYCHYGYVLGANRRTCIKKDENEVDNCRKDHGLDCQHFCVTTLAGSSCGCSRGFELASSDKQTCIDIDECNDTSTNNCSADATCVNTNGSYICQCQLGTKLENDGRTCTECDDFHYGENCASQCQCLHGFCNRTTGCVCDIGWLGKDCDEDMEECDTSPSPCSEPHTMCVNSLGSFSCDCLLGYHKIDGNCTAIEKCNTTAAQECEAKKAECAGGIDDPCVCAKGYAFDESNSTCIDIKECAQTPSPCHQNCLELDGRFTCLCSEGYYLLNDGFTCEECGDSHFGFNCSQTCDCNIENSANAYQTCDNVDGICNCKATWQGAICEEDVNECDNQTVCSSFQNTACRNIENGYTCECVRGYVKNDTDVCVPKPTVPSTTIDLDIHKVVSVTIVLQVSLPEDYNLNLDQVYENVSSEAHKTLVSFYKTYVEGDFEVKIKIKDIRRGSLAVYHDLVYNKADEAIELALLEALLTVANGNSSFTYLEAVVHGVLGTGNANSICEVYETFISPCPDGFICSINEKKPSCTTLPGKDSDLLAVLIIVPSLSVVFVVVFFTVCLWLFCRKKTARQMNKARDVSTTSWDGLSSADHSIQHKWTGNGAWQSVVAKVFGTERGIHMKPYRMPRAWPEFAANCQEEGGAAEGNVQDESWQSKTATTLATERGTHMKPYKIPRPQPEMAANDPNLF